MPNLFSCFVLSTAWRLRSFAPEWLLKIKLYFQRKNLWDFTIFCQIWQSLYRRNTCLGAFANVNSREKFQFWGRKIFFSQIVYSYENLTKLFYFGGICVADSNIYCQHVYLQCVSFSLGVCQAHSRNFILVKKHWRSNSSKLISHILQFS